MAELIEKFGPIPIRPRHHPTFDSLTRAIIFQQLSGKAAETILGRFIGLFGKVRFPEPHHVLGFNIEQLRAAGLSRPKATYILGLAEHAIAGTLPTLEKCRTMTDEEIIEQLTNIKGVGRWTAEMLLISNLGRMDVLPVHDLGVRRGFQMAYKKRKMPSPEQLHKHGLRWSPYRTFAARYLWRAAD
jgi:3-methyladenine DNA glycosylase/8-oxoguanine DNA glycosylase